MTDKVTELTIVEARLEHVLDQRTSTSNAFTGARQPSDTSTSKL